MLFSPFPLLSDCKCSLDLQRPPAHGILQPQKRLGGKRSLILQSRFSGTEVLRNTPQLSQPSQPSIANQLLTQCLARAAGAILGDGAGDREMQQNVDIWWLIQPSAAEWPQAWRRPPALSPRH